MRGRNTGQEENRPAVRLPARPAIERTQETLIKMLVHLLVVWVPTPNLGIYRGKGNVPPRREDVKIFGIDIL
ncbi:MAG: hypothetical protein BECKG1743D_GA0114223_101314 [Candidatus Kentron sp. G]|nr:MAG: hypothetical protein BECKG1743F_GA0114225_100834 [Candidatus Kentron sp. G]VFM98067.1 MAG: hypothetical protein BECKG1743E_GA0114224_101663 [Candidatus Kentron sp. G]VFM99565.1 MAG: hypothetical protein BECKG1743D_GA0114223_101314 [Candidatus Kentron sp. G]